MAASNSMTFVGAHGVHGNADAKTGNAGAAFSYDTGPLSSPFGSLLQVFQRPASFTGDFFGYSISALSDKLIVGAPDVNVGFPGPFINSDGQAYLFDTTTFLFSNCTGFKNAFKLLLIDYFLLSFII